MKNWFSIGAWMAALGVALGAFGAHVLRDRLTPDMLAVFETGARYHLIHALGLLAIGAAGTRQPARSMDVGGSLLLLGIVLFSGSLYALSCSGIRVLGIITPFGGVAWIAGWIVLARTRPAGGADE